ncbi:MAG TPA: hypothetical protein VGR91_04025 [Stellaceae bacterium]|nr:hypothetical protein [Stellaceae bacterium]
MIRPSHVALVVSAALASACASGAIAGFVSGLIHSPQLMRFLLIPSILLMTHFAGRWIARRQSPPAKPEFMIGGMIYVLLSISEPLSQGQAGVGLAVLGSGGFVLLVVYSALTTVRTPKLAGAV